jgi:hypothetical protein
MADTGSSSNQPGCQNIYPNLENLGANLNSGLQNSNNGVKLKSVSEDLLLSAERDDVRMTLQFLY